MLDVYKRQALVISWVLVGMMGFTTTTIGEVAADSPAMQAGLAAGDKICLLYTSFARTIRKAGIVKACISLQCSTM